MAYGRYFRKQRMVAVKPATKKSNTPRRKIYSKKPQVSFAQKVNQIISKNVENKMTLSYNVSDYVCSTTATGVFNWYIQKDWNTKLFTLSQGSTVQSRIGNQIKLKRWIIRGQIAPYSTTLNNDGTAYLPSSVCGHIDIYFGRSLDNNEMTSALTALYENGSSSSDPNGTQAQIFRTINKDQYKIYYHKRFKMSPANLSNSTNLSGALTNNDFSLTRTFGFDVCKYICKNSIIKYNDADNDPNNFMIRQLALFATWTPAVGDLEKGASYANNHTFYKINLQAYAEYEDA